MAKPAPSRVAAALQYLQQMRDRAADFGGGVVDTLGERAQDVGGLAYEALTSDPNIGRMTTAEFSQAAADRPSTPRLDATAQGIGAMGKALVTQPVQTAKAVVVDPVVEAFESPRAMGQFAGEFVNPLRIAAALRKTAPIAELDVYHGTPHRFDPTEENPLGEFDASKIGTGEGAQAYGHGIYFAENPSVASSYRSPKHFPYEELIKKENKEYRDAQANLIKLDRAIRKIYPDKIPQNTVSAIEFVRVNKKNFPSEIIEKINQAEFAEQSAYQTLSRGPFYKADLPDEMIDRMVDYDAPIGSQSEPVKQALRKAFGDYAIKYASGNNMTWKDFKSMFGFTDEAKFSEQMQKSGIPGIRYLDAGSRGKDGTGTRNFVVFPGEEKKVKILKRD